MRQRAGEGGGREQTGLTERGWRQTFGMIEKRERDSEPRAKVGKSGRG